MTLNMKVVYAMCHKHVMFIRCMRRASLRIIDIKVLKYYVADVIANYLKGIVVWWRLHTSTSSPLAWPEHDRSESV